MKQNGKRQYQRRPNQKKQFQMQTQQALISGVAALASIGSMFSQLPLFGVPQMNQMNQPQMNQMNQPQRNKPQRSKPQETENAEDVKEGFHALLNEDISNAKTLLEVIHETYDLKTVTEEEIRGIAGTLDEEIIQFVIGIINEFR